jgi:hypothetical protein
MSASWQSGPNRGRPRLRFERAVALWIAFYNFCRVHETLGCSTPAMPLGVTDHVWSIAELIDATNDSRDVPPLEPIQELRTKIGAPKLRLIRGGRR